MIGANITSTYVYRTSKGIWEDFNEAEKKCNRAKITDPNDPNFGKRENVQTIIALTDGDNFFSAESLRVIPTLWP